MKTSTFVVAILIAAVSTPALAQKTGGKPAPTPAQPTPPPAQPTTPPPPQPQPPPPPEPKKDEAPTLDIDALRQEYLKLRDELYQSRARAAAVASALYSTKITVRLAYTSGRFYTVNRATVRLDGASVYDDTEGAIAADDAVRFEGWIAPGRHVLSIRVEATGKDDERFTSATEATFVVQAVGGKDLIVVARAKDGGDIPYEWKRGEHGTYKLSVDADVKTVKRAGEKQSAAKPAKKETPRVARRK
jgi:hypothetical protein